MMVMFLSDILDGRNIGGTFLQVMLHVNVTCGANPHGISQIKKEKIMNIKLQK